MLTKFQAESLKGRDSVDLYLPGVMILSWSLKNQGVTGLNRLRIGSMADFGEHGDEPTGFLIPGNFLAI
jgi:hypothetical protein